MRAAIEKWQATALVALIIVAAALLAYHDPALRREVVIGILGYGTFLLGAGSNAHGVRQGSKATADPPPEN